MEHSVSLRSYFRFSLLLRLCVPVGADLARGIGVPSDGTAQAAWQECRSMANSTEPMTFDYGACPILVRCVLDHLPSDAAAGYSSGASMASLVPTILAIVGAGPLDLVQLAFISPHRAVFTCIFGIGLPSGLFRQLQVHLPHLTHENTNTPRIREWYVPVPRPARRGNIRLVKTVLIDIAILSLGCIMLYRNAYVGTQTVVTWRCEYSWLLLCWPIACFVWLVIAIILIHIFAKHIEITYSEDTPGVRRSRLDLLKLPYYAPEPKSFTNSAAEMASPRSCKVQRDRDPIIRSEVLSPSITHTPIRPRDPVEPYFKIAIEMRTDKSWRWFESTIECLAVGIYLYATFIFASVLFLSGSQAIIYASILILSLSAIRILEAL